MSKTSEKNKKWKLSRRDFLKVTGAATAGGSLIEGLELIGPNAALASSVTTEVKSLCQYCSAGCGVTLGLDVGGNLVDIYGDRDNPVNNGGLCCKGQAKMQLVNSAKRETGLPQKCVGGVWSTMLSWDAALNEIANRLQNVAYGGDGVAGAGPNKTAAGVKAVAFMGSAHMTNEECYLYRKLVALFGNNNIEHQARI